MRKILPGGGSATATFRSTRIIPSAVGGAIEGTLTLNGRSQPARLQVTNPAPGRYRGTVPVVQSAFGIKPYTGFFGALKLRDEVAAEFEVDLNRSELSASLWTSSHNCPTVLVCLPSTKMGLPGRPG